jgi:hypothetical protein
LEENQIRNSTIKSKTDSILLCLLGENYRNAIDILNHQNLQEIIKIIKKMFIFSKKFYLKLIFIFIFIFIFIAYLSDEQHKLLASKMKKKIYKDIIKEEGEFFDRIYFIIKGKVECVQNDVIKNNFSENQFFGEVGLFIDFMTNWRYQANGEVIVYELYNFQVAEILGKEYLNIIMENLFRSTIPKCENLKSYLTTENIITLYNIFRLEFYFSNKIVFRKEKEINKKISIIVSGKLVKEDDKNITLAKTEDIYGKELIDKKEK